MSAMDCLERDRRLKAEADARRRPTPSPELVASIRKMAERESFFSSSIYPYAFGRIEGMLDGPEKPAGVIKRLRELIAAVDLVIAERKP